MAGCTDAASLKQQGNERFKAGELRRASELYAQAEVADPNDPVYPSNLSAALYEIGDYPNCVDAVLRAWRLLRDKSDAKADLVVRLSSRLAKSLCHGVRGGSISTDSVAEKSADMKQLRDAAAEKSTVGPAKEEHARVWQEWDAMEPEIRGYIARREESLRKFSRLPMFFKPLDHTKEFFSVGTDEIIDLTEGWGFHERYPLEINKLPMKLLGDVAFLFGGVGDGRHAFGTIAGLLQAFQKLPKGKQSKFRAHLTLLDIHDATIARDLTIFMLLHELNNATDTVARLEIKTTLMYTYCGAAMPSYCHARLQSVIKELRRRLTESPPDLPPWLHVVSDTIPAILPTLDYWLTAKKTTRRTLENHEHMSANDRPDMRAMTMLPGGNADFQRTLQEKIAAERAAIENTLRNLTPAQLAEWEVFPKETPVAARRAYLDENMEQLVDEFFKASRGGKLPLYEEAWYKGAKVFLPPKELWRRHPNFEAAWTQTRANWEMPKSAQSKIQSQIEAEWRPNITLFDLNCADPNCYSDGDGYPDLKLDMFDTVAYMDQFNRRNGPNAQDTMRTNQEMLAASTCGAFFDEVAAAIKGLGDGRLTVELICGGLSEEMIKMQYRVDSTRPAEFPRKFMRMWLSNVPDYTHGPQNVIIYNVPNLQDDPQAAVAFNCMLNVPVWGGDPEYFHTYTLLLPEEVPRYFGCRLISSRAVMDVCVLGAQPVPRPLSKLATRDELTTWLTRILFNTFIPGQSKLRPHNVRCPHNLVAFFTLLLYLHRVGYPAHWLSEFLARVLSGRMLSDIPPYDDFWPIPLKARGRRVAPRRVRTDPWLVDFENILASAYHALPFPLPSTALPADFSRDPADIALWEVGVRPAQRFSTDPFMNFSSPYDPRTQLLFYRSAATTAHALIGDMARIFEGKREPPPGTFFVLTMQEYVQYQTRVRFRLSRKRVERMRREKWSMVAYRHDTGQKATLPVPVEKWRLVTDEAASVV